MWMPYSEERSRMTTFRSGTTLSAFLMTVAVRLDFPEPEKAKIPQWKWRSFSMLTVNGDLAVGDPEQVAELVVGGLFPWRGCSR